MTAPVSLQEVVTSIREMLADGTADTVDLEITRGGTVKIRASKGGAPVARQPMKSGMRG